MIIKTCDMSPHIDFNVTQNPNIKEIDFSNCNSLLESLLRFINHPLSFNVDILMEEYMFASTIPIAAEDNKYTIYADSEDIRDRFYINIIKVNNFPIVIRNFVFDDDVFANRKHYFIKSFIKNPRYVISIFYDKEFFKLEDYTEFFMEVIENMLYKYYEDKVFVNNCGSMLLSPYVSVDDKYERIYSSTGYIVMNNDLTSTDCIFGANHILYLLASTVFILGKDNKESISKYFFDPMIVMGNERWIGIKTIEDMISNIDKEYIYVIENNKEKISDIIVKYAKKLYMEEFRE